MQICWWHFETHQVHEQHLTACHRPEGPGGAARPLSDVVCSWLFEWWTWNDLLTIPAFYTHRMLELMPHWKWLSFSFLVLAPICKSHCTQWDHYVENTKWGVYITPIQLPPYPKTLWSETNIYPYISLTYIPNLLWVVYIPQLVSKHLHFLFYISTYKIHGWKICK